MHKITLNGSVHKDLAKIIKAVSTIKAAKPLAPVSVLVTEDGTLVEHQNNSLYHSVYNNAQHSQIKEVFASSVIKIFIAGTGTVGAELVQQLFALNDNRCNYLLTGICNSRNALLNEAGLSKDAVSRLTETVNTKPTNWDEIIYFLKNKNTGNLIFVDATGSREVSKRYEELLDSGIHVVTASKLSNTDTQVRFNKLNSYEHKNVYYRYEATAGAGLPVIQTIKNLLLTGDEITQISGVVSGTMTYIFDALQQGIPFSVAVKTAAEKGYAEPDPRDDLSGEDVARKFLILARVSGYSLERSSFVAEDQTPDALKDVSLLEFYEKLPDYDTFWDERIKHAASKNEVLRYVGELKNGKIHIGVKSVPADSPLGSLRGTDNQISIFTNIYQHSPIIIQGPGAGREVTAQALLSEIRQITGRLSKRVEDIYA